MIPIFVDEKVMKSGAYTPGEQSNDADVNSIYSAADELQKMKNDLKKAVENEDYEKAANLRDKIRDMESGSSKI